MNVDEIRHALREAGLERLAEQVEHLTLPAIRIDVQAVDEDTLPVGASKIGGRPDLSPDVVWPVRGDIPLGFLAQFNLAEVAPYDIEHVLPPTGMLYFFYDFGREPWGLEPWHRSGWQVIYRVASRPALKRVTHPEDAPAKGILNPHALTFSTAQTLARDRAFMARFDLSRDEIGQYRDLLYAVGLRMQILGHPNYIHYTEMPLYCEVLSSGGTHDDIPSALDGSLDELDKQTKAAAIQAAHNWRLLFQLGALPGTDASSAPLDEDGIPDFDHYDPWGRDGIMYFWVQADRLVRRDFSNVWMLGASEF